MFLRGRQLEKRIENRSAGAKIQYPVSCVLRHEGTEFTAEVVNYHYRGACLRVPDSMKHDERILAGDFKLDFLLGKVPLQQDIPYRICWNEIKMSGTLGIEFLAKTNKITPRAERFLVNMAHRPRVEANDPLDPNRVLFLNVNDVSETGLLAQTSLTNKHILPGMRLPRARLIIPGHESLAIDFAVENTRRGSGDDSFLLGLSVLSDRTEYKQALRTYLTQMAPMANSADEHLSKLADSGFLSKKLKGAVSYRTITTKSDYEDVLKLRFIGYGKHNKVRDGSTWEQQGDGLDREGLIIGGYLGGKLVCSMEVRFGEDPLPLRSEQLNGNKPIQGIDRRRVVEINKLVIHPKLQGSDVVIGMMQRVHAIVVTRGQFDVLLAATDQLSPLYERIGAAKIGIRVPHPFLIDEFLNIMVVRREVYHDGIRFNPHAWNTIYQSLHDHFFSLGLTTEKKFSFLEKLKLLSSKKLEPIVRKLHARKKKKGPQSAKNRNSPRLKSQGFIDPKWTRQEILATVMHPYIVAASEMIGDEKVDRILDEIGINRDYIKSQVNWLSVAFHDEFLDRFSVHADPSVLSRNAGIRSLARDIQGVNYYFLKHFMSLHTVFQHMTRVGQKFNRTRTYELIKSGSNTVTLALGATAPSLLPRRRESCLNWQASFEALILLMTGKPGKVMKTSCCYEGHHACTYELKWESRGVKGLAYSRILLGSVLVATTFFSARLFFDALTAWIIGGGALMSFLAGSLAVALRRQKRSFDSASREFEEFQRDAGEKYSELQESKKRVDEMYREARVLEQTSRDIQRNKDLGDILRVVLNGACLNFGFDRAFVMLINESRTKLQTAAIAGVDDSAELLWKFSVDVGKRRENAVVLSSVFHSGNPIVINDVEAHLFQLNEASRKIIQQFGSQGFVIVQIPGRDGCWGVLVADQQTRKHNLGQRDIKILERLGQQLGVALDKRSDYEREERLRNHFQRYVPASVVAESLGQSTPVLGGQMREIVAMFVDIRGFTAMAASLTPTATVNLLNRFFSVLEPTISEYGGTIDKYLGDGALITWGSIGTKQLDPTRAVDAALALVERIAELNTAQSKSGHPKLEIGIGLHVGSAVVGNIGSQNRVEFTSIGSTVNLASRLEGQCKVLNCSIVASESTGLQPGRGWEKITDVEIRGLTELQTVWAYRPLGQAKLRVIERTVA